jgi:hypothetical protein
MLGGRRDMNISTSTGGAQPYGQPIAGGVGGVRANGQGGMLLDDAVRSASWQRMWSHATSANRGGVPYPGPTGDLPAGLHAARWGEITTRYAGGPRRANLTTQLGDALGIMHKAGVEQAVVGGSYVGAKVAPGDVDVAILARRDGTTPNVRQIQRSVSKVAPDVHVYAGWQPVGNAHVLPGARAGENFLELFMHDRGGTARGALLVQPQAAKVGGRIARLLAAVR